MGKKTIRILIKLLLGISFTLLLSSCHSEYLHLEIRTDGSLAWNKDRSAFAFIAKTCLYRKPVGIAKFPDGGTSKNEYLDFSLYYFDITQKKLTHLISLNEFYLGSAYRWLSISQLALSLQDSSLFYKLIEPFDYNMKYIDEKKNPDFLEDIAKTYKIDIFTRQKDVVDTTIYKHLFDNKQERLKNSSAKNYFSDLSLSDWGIFIKDIYPQSKKTYMNYIIEGEGGSNILEAIFQQIVPGFNEKDRNYILDKMAIRQQKFFKDFNKLNEEKDPYRKSLRKGQYENYIIYFEDIKNRLINHN